MTSNLIERLINKEYLTERERKELLSTIKKHFERLKFENQALRNGIDLDLIAKLLSENEKLKKDNNTLEALLSQTKNYYIKTIVENEKLKKAIEILKSKNIIKIYNFDKSGTLGIIIEDYKLSTLLLHNGKKTKGTYFKITQQEYDLLKEVLGNEN